MNTNHSNKSITISLYNGYIDDTLSDSENIKTTIFHEFDHVSGRDELHTLYDVIRSLFYKGTTIEYKKDVVAYINSLVEKMPRNDRQRWIKEFMKYGVNF